MNTATATPTAATRGTATPTRTPRPPAGGGGPPHRPAPTAVLPNTGDAPGTSGSGGAPALSSGNQPASVGPPIPGLPVPEVAGAVATGAPRDARFACADGEFRVNNDLIWSFFRARGGLRVFGCPVSRGFRFQGFTVQFFQQRIVQLDEHGAPRLLNVLDPDLMPYSHINGSTFPEVDPQLKARTPRVGDADYVSGILSLVDEVVPDTFADMPVNFHLTFNSLITPDMAGTNDPNVVGMLSLSMWGAPTSLPVQDPTNADLVYQRFQRQIMVYDARCDCVTTPLLATYLKDIILDDSLPPDLMQSTLSSGLFDQYAPDRPGWVRDPAALPYTDMTYAFMPE
jgi:hypothetical protein